MYPSSSVHLRIVSTIQLEYSILLTLGCAEGQLVLARRTLRQLVPLTEHVWMELAELDGGSTNAPHPFTVTDVLCNESRPNGNCLQRSAAGGRLEAYTARVFVSEDTEGVAEACVGDLTAACQRMCHGRKQCNVPAVLYLLVLAIIEHVFEAIGNAGLILALHRDGGAVEQYHSYAMLALCHE